jgi:hypothetical protein
MLLGFVNASQGSTNFVENAGFGKLPRSRLRGGNLFAQGI